MKRSILIVDPDCPKPYSSQSLHAGPLGGTEATVVRVAVGLAGRGHKVVVAQGSRQETDRSISGVRFVPLQWDRLFGAAAAPQVVILLNTPKLLSRLRRQYPQASLYLWLHCFPGKRRRKMLNKWAVATNTTLIAVSETLAEELKQHLRSYPNYGRHKPTGGKMAMVATVYNPIDDGLLPNDTPVDPTKLVFFSSPHKGLRQVLTAFARVKERLPKLTLYVANPGYWPLPNQIENGDVVVLGALPHREVMQHVREAYCVFYPQNRFKETFGLVFAEANAVGTPVITHPLAAAAEVLEDQQQLVDVSDAENVVERLVKWYNQGRPQVQLPAKFRLQHVLSSWENLLAEPPVGLQKVQ